MTHSALKPARADLQSALLVFCLESALIAPAFASEDEMFRCGRWLVSREMGPDEVLKKCGEPSSRKVENKEVYVPVGGSGATRKITLQVETWRYDRGNRAAAMVITVYEGRIESMRYAE